MQQSDQTLAVGMQKAEVARTTEAFGQHMLQDQPQKLRAGNGPGFHLPGLGVAITETDLAIVASENILFGDDAPVKITAQVDKRLLAVADGFAIHHPLVWVTPGQRQSRGFDAP